MNQRYHPILAYICPLAVIESCPSKLLIIQSEAQGVNQVEIAARVGTKAHDVARIGWYLWFI
jgi:hypothetical protein